MNKTGIEVNRDRTYNVTLPHGANSHALPLDQAVERLKQGEDEYQKALDDIKAQRAYLEKKLGKP